MSRTPLVRWIIFHSSLFLYFLIVVLFLSRAHASCTPREVSDGVWQVESGEGTLTAEIRRSMIERELARHLQDLQDLQQVTGSSRVGRVFTVFLKCSGAGLELAVAVSAERDAPALCLHGDIGLRDAQVFSDNDARPGVPCEGESPLKLLVGVTNATTLPVILGHLRRPPLDALIENGQIENPALISLKLRHELRYREKIARSRLERDPTLEALVTYVDYDHVLGVIGETHELFTAHLAN